MMIDQYPGKSKIHENINKKIPLPPPKNRTAYGTHQYFAEPGALETFLRDSRQILIQNFQNVRIQGTGEYWTCNQDRDPWNWNC
jgi:hypothetical protein